jgi:hypothetical protein
MVDPDALKENLDRILHSPLVDLARPAEESDVQGHRTNRSRYRVSFPTNYDSGGVDGPRCMRRSFRLHGQC